MSKPDDIRTPFTSRHTESAVVSLTRSRRQLFLRRRLLVRHKAVDLALAITSEGDKDVLGLWIEQTEGAKFWLKVMNELQDPRPAGYPRRGGGRAQGLSLRHRHGVPAHRGPEYTLTPPPSCPTRQDHLSSTSGARSMAGGRYRRRSG